MTVALQYLTLVALLTAVSWIPYILNTISVRGLANAVGYPENPEPLAPWAQRMKAAHYNSVENLVILAALVLIAHEIGVNTQTTAVACIVYFWARLVHLVVYTMGIPWLRTLSFAVGFVCQLTIAWQILA